MYIASLVHCTVPSPTNGFPLYFSNYYPSKIDVVVTEEKMGHVRYKSLPSLCQGRSHVPRCARFIGCWQAGDYLFYSFGRHELCRNLDRSFQKFSWSRKIYAVQEIIFHVLHECRILKPCPCRIISFSEIIFVWVFNWCPRDFSSVMNNTNDICYTSEAWSYFFSEFQSFFVRGSGWVKFGVPTILSILVYILGLGTAEINNYRPFIKNNEILER